MTNTEPTTYKRFDVFFVEIGAHDLCGRDPSRLHAVVPRDQQPAIKWRADVAA